MLLLILGYLAGALTAFIIMRAIAHHKDKGTRVLNEGKRVSASKDFKESVKKIEESLSRK